jgi:3-methyladenine DNA glycosylase AlkD
MKATTRNRERAVKKVKVKDAGLKIIITKLTELSTPTKSKTLSKYFKTGANEYGYGDIFLGVSMPEIRSVLKTCNLPILELDLVLPYLHSEIHEIRMFAVLALVQMYGNADSKDKESIVMVYLKNSHWINNWDLVDVSAHHILGHYIYTFCNTQGSENVKGMEIINLLVNGIYPIEISQKTTPSNFTFKQLWQQRIAIVACLYPIKQNCFHIAKYICQIYIETENQYDLIHKATGWILREIGKKEIEELKLFLKKWGGKMKRVTLRYAIERFPLDVRKAYLKKIDK